MNDEPIGILKNTEDRSDGELQISQEEYTRSVLNDVELERERQNTKWGEQNHSAFPWLAILGEEVGEANQAALSAHFGNRGWAHYREELIQVAAVAVAMVECLDRHNGEMPK